MKRIVFSIILFMLTNCGQKDNTSPAFVADIDKNEITLSSFGSVNGDSDFSVGKLGCKVSEDGSEVLIVAVTKSHDQVIELFQVRDRTGAIISGDEKELSNEGQPIAAVHYVVYGENMHFSLAGSEKCQIKYTTALNESLIKGTVNCSILSHDKDEKVSVKANFSCSKDDGLKPEVTEENVLHVLTGA